MEMDLELVPEEIVEDSEVYLVLKGLLIDLEINSIISLVSKEPSETSFPIYIEIEGDSKKVGYLEPTLDKILEIRFLSNNYELVIIDKSSGQSKTILSANEEISGNSLMNFVSLV